MARAQRSGATTTGAPPARGPEGAPASNRRGYRFVVTVITTCAVAVPPLPSLAVTFAV